MAYTAEQQRNIEAIIRVGRQLGASERDIQIALAVAKQESGFRILDYGDKAGPDSRGLFQQRTWWGPLSVRMDAEGSARLFFQGGKDGSPGLLDIKNRGGMSFGDAAYAVQKFSKQYKSRYDQAAKDVAPLLNITVREAPPKGSGPTQSGGATTRGRTVAPDPRAHWVTTPSGQRFPDANDDGKADDFVPDEDMGDHDPYIARLRGGYGGGGYGGGGYGGGYGGGGYGGGGGEGGLPGSMSDQEAAVKYGYAVSFFASVPELYSLFRRAVAEQWTPERFAGAFQDSRWYKTHSEAYRQIYAQKMSDPATYQLNVSKQRAAIMDTAGALGVPLDAKTIQKLTDDSLAQGWTPEILRNHLSNMIAVVKSTGHFGGTAGDIEKDLRRMAADYGQKISDKTLLQNIKAIAAGNGTMNDFQAYLSAQAELLFPGHADRLKKGFTLRDVADPYIEQMAYLLEVDPSGIDLFDPNIQGALMGKSMKGADGKDVPFSMYDFQQQIRKDPRWSKTKQAQDVTSAAAMKVLQDFGFMA